MSGHLRNKVEPQMNGNITSGSIQNKMDNALDANNNYTCTTSRNDFWILTSPNVPVLFWLFFIEIKKSTLSALESLVDSIGTNHPYNAMTQLMEDVMIDYEINMKLDNVQLWHNKKRFVYPRVIIHRRHFSLKLLVATSSLWKSQSLRFSSRTPARQWHF